MGLASAAAFFARSNAGRIGPVQGETRDTVTSVAPVGKKVIGSGSVLVRNGVANEPWLDKKCLLTEFTGAYTTARTIEQKSIFELSMHCSRLATTATAVWSEEVSTNNNTQKALEFLQVHGIAGLKHLVQKEILIALSYLDERLETYGGPKCEYQVTLVLTADSVGPHTPTDRYFDIYTFAQPLPHMVPMVEVAVHRADRSNPTIKDVQWVRDRKNFEDLQKELQVNEVLMVNDEGRVTEGLQTNFFAVDSEHRIWTAPENLVLAGTVRKVVLEAARRNAIPIVFQGPSMENMETWESCFICSTSRLVKPISKIIVPGSKVAKQFADNGTVAHRMEKLVVEAFRNHAESLLTDG